MWRGGIAVSAPQRQPLPWSLGPDQTENPDRGGGRVLQFGCCGNFSQELISWDFRRLGPKSFESSSCDFTACLNSTLCLSQIPAPLCFHISSSNQKSIKLLLSAKERAFIFGSIYLTRDMAFVSIRSCILGWVWGLVSKCWLFFG